MTGCKGDDGIYLQPVELSPLIGADGGIVEGLGGDVVLAIPPGALLEDIHFNMYEMNAMTSKSGSDRYGELLRTFIIEPSVTFRVPATLTVYVDGCLSDGNSICEEAEISFHIRVNFTKLFILSLALE